MTRLRSHPLLVTAIGLGLLGVVTVAACASGDSGAAALLPLLALLAMLVAGWYVGAERLERILRSRRGPRRRGPAAIADRGRRVVALAAGDRPMASGLARRPPPAGLVAA